MTRTMLVLFTSGMGLFVSSLLGIAWGVDADGWHIVHWEVVVARRTAWRRRLPLVSLLLFLGALLVGWATQLSTVQSVDRVIGQQLALRQGSSAALVLHALVRFGDPHPMLYGAMVVVVMAAGRGRAQALRLVAFAMVGTFGLELCGKILFPQVHTTEFLGQALSNYPSGTAMRAMVLALVLLVVWGPAHRRSWPRVWLRRAVVGWPILMSTALVVLRWHTLSEVVGGLLFGAAWVSLCLRLLLRHGEAEVGCGRGTATVRRGPGCLRGG
jgi:membrane-associated phospholipid phosphatase